MDELMMKLLSRKLNL